MAFSLTIAGTALVPPVCKVLNLQILLSGADHRGDDRLVPGTAGVIPYPRRKTVTKHRLELIILGSTYAVYETNWATVKAITDPVTIAPGTRAATLTLFSGATKTAAIHSGPLEVGDFIASNTRATLTISIPAGEFA